MRKDKEGLLQRRRGLQESVEEMFLALERLQRPSVGDTVKIAGYRWSKMKVAKVKGDEVLVDCSEEGSWFPRMEWFALSDIVFTTYSKRKAEMVKNLGRAFNKEVAERDKIDNILLNARVLKPVVAREYGTGDLPVAEEVDYIN